MTQINVTITVGSQPQNFTLSNDAQAPANMQQVTGMEMVGLSKALASQANDRGETFGLHIVGSPSDGVDIIANAIKDETIKVYR